MSVFGKTVMSKTNYRNIILCAVAIVVIGALTQGAIRNYSSLGGLEAPGLQWATFGILHATQTMVSLYIITLLVWVLRLSHNAKERLKQVSEIIDTMSDCVLTINSNGKLEICNQVCENMFGWNQSELQGRALTSLVTAEDGSGNIDLESQSWLMGGDSGLERLDHKTLTCIGLKRNGSNFQAELFVSKNNEIGSDSFTCVIKDISQRLKSEETIRNLASCDPLTGLANRSEFHRKLDTALAEAEMSGHCVGVMLLDLDKFNLVNQVCGHELGDELLKEVAGRLRRSLGDVFGLARLGGDEFAIIVSGLEKYQETIVPAEGILASFEDPILIEGVGHRVSASIGISCYPADSRDGGELFRQAGIALTHAKDASRGSYHLYNAQLDEQVKTAKSIEDGLCRALDGEEFMLYYQPQVDMNGQLVGVESLLRWRLPNGDCMPAGDFIPIAESTGLIVEIGEWALFEGCRQAKAWQDAGLPHFRVAINISAAQFAETDLVETVAQALAQSGLAPEDLELEITESMVMQDIDHAVEVLAKLHRMGVELALDDFGTGYASLTYLKRMPVDRLKIDRSFVAGVPDDQGDAAITKSVVSLSREMGLEVIAEGVENARQLAFLGKCGCHVAQGYFIGHPMAAETFEEWLGDRTKPAVQQLQDKISQS